MEKIEKLKIVDIIKLVKWKAVKRALDYHYPEDKNNYKPVFQYIKTFRKRKQKDINEVLKVYANNEKLIKDMPYPYNYYGINTNKYSLSFRKWSEVSNIIISKGTLEYNTLEDIVAHFIWEITFYGNEKDMMKTKKEVDKSVKDLEKQLELEKEKNSDVA